MLYKPDVNEIARFSGKESIEALSGETSVYAASPAFVRKHCGPLANKILEQVPQAYFDLCEQLGMLPNIDVRVHRLNKGEYPAVPGWHCDGGYRETYFSSPDMERFPIRDTLLATVSSSERGISNFEVIDQDVEFSPSPEQSTDKEFSHWGELNRLLVRDKVKGKRTQDGVLYSIGAHTIHRCTPALERGWRLFFRMSMWHNDYLGEQGKIAKQQQVYVSAENGW